MVKNQNSFHFLEYQRCYTDSIFKNLSSDAKVLYGILLDRSENRGRKKSYGTNYQKLDKELMTQDKLAVMDSRKCILQLRVIRPFLSDKFDITNYKNYEYLSDFNKKKCI